MENTKTKRYILMDGTSHAQIHTFQLYTCLYYLTYNFTPVLTKQPQPQLAQIQSVIPVYCSFSLHVNSNRFVFVFSCFRVCFSVFHLLPDEDYDTLVKTLFSKRNYCQCPVSLSFRACFLGVRDVVQRVNDHSAWLFLCCRLVI